MMVLVATVLDAAIPGSTGGDVLVQAFEVQGEAHRDGAPGR